MKKLIILVLSFFVFACSDNTKKEFSLTDHIPQDTEIFLVSQDIQGFVQELAANDFIKSNKFPLKERISSQLKFLEHLNLNHETGISFSNLASETFTFTITTKKDSALVQLDSVKNKAVETITEGNVDFQRIELNNSTFFLHESGNTAIISNSRQKILDIGNQTKLLKNESFEKAFNASDPNKSSVFIKHNAIEEISDFFNKFNFPNFENFAEWSVLDLDVSGSGFRANGLSLGSSSTKLLEVFSGTTPKNIESARICPEDFLSMYALSFSSFGKLHSNLQKIKTDTTQANYPKVLDHIREIASIQLKNGDMVVLNAVEIEAAKEQLAGIGDPIETYRGSSIVELNTDLGLRKVFSGLLNMKRNKFYTIIEHFILFSNDADVLKKALTDFQNSDVISERSYFNELIGSLSSESSMIFIAQLPEFIEETSENDKSQKLKLKKNSLAALQIISEGDFAHLHGIFSNSENSDVAANGAEQMASIKLDHPLVTNPVFFKNHRTDQMDIAVQDENNLLYLISNKGNIFWKKQMDSQITSPIYQVDLFKNGNQQLAFSTGYNMEVLDRDGNKVKGFPIKFNSALTQPLSVFDYDKNRNYRFVLTQNQRVYMVGPKGKAIRGFDFEKAGSDVIKAPKHIRLGSKDYILVAEESGKLNILSRQGNIRVPVTENIDFSENDWYGYNGKFVSTAPENELIEISQQGQVSTKNLELAENNRVVANDDHLVYLNENQLSIDGNIINLDYGLYTDPQLFEFRKRTLIALTDTQTHKVYVFDQKGKLLDGFPVYGNSPVDIANADLDSRLELVVKGEENEILLYKL
ncbi:hypothetical protein NE848_16515 [Gramella jeungdoensis]|uniref:Uncharacterized protein n=1 Tax=Gramella jeungdoensis TaxID=708091 RepID=A0ABT0Z6E9_9FLAO|nr:hypothetical protein [Gramella jeungdoensis]MCM8571003.1 hypothetical protein [Gramella jeungdoensis]